jgi:hypothetical protein
MAKTAVVLRGVKTLKKSNFAIVFSFQLLHLCTVESNTT